MSFSNLFTKQNIHDVLKSTFSSLNESEITFSVEKCSENFTLLNFKSNDVQQKFFLNKIPKYLDKFVVHPRGKNSQVLYPVFFIEDDAKESYGAFETEYDLQQFVPPKENDAENLKIILENLAKYQADDLVNGREEKEIQYIEDDLTSIISTVTSLDDFKHLDSKVIKQSIEDLQSNINKLDNDARLLVKSISSPLAKNVYINHDLNKIIFLNSSSPKVVPLAYDALMYIFALSNERFRQQYFEDLIIHYFASLKKFLRQLQTNLVDNLTRRICEHQVKVLLPVVKLKIASSLFKLEKSLKLQEILRSLINFFEYSLINQEDIYEILRNMLGSSDYKLLNYSLRSLSGTNGHLGEYFHLHIKFKTQEGDKEVKLFAKFLNPGPEMFKKIVETGPAIKEDFFYKVLVPLYIKHGLESLVDFAPRYYLSRISWLLVLDDLSQQNYTGLKPNVVLNYDGLKATVESLAKFHACTIILEEILSKESGKTVRFDEDYGIFLEDNVYVYDDSNPIKAMLDSHLKMLFYIVEKFPEITTERKISKEIIRARLKSAFESTFIEMMKSDKIRNVIQHGDAYISNMLYKFEEGKSIKKCKIVDFQMLRYGPPTYELLFFLFENSMKETRDNYFKTLIEQYYQYVGEYITKFNFDPEIVFPKKIFDENIKSMMLSGAIGAFMHAHQLHINPDFIEEVLNDEEKFNYYFIEHKQELVDNEWSSSEHYRNMMRGLVEDILDIIHNEI